MLKVRTNEQCPIFFCIFATDITKNNNMATTAKPNWKKIFEMIAAIATLIAGFIGGQATARTGKIDIFNKYPQNEEQVKTNSVEGLSCLILKSKENGQI